ncbi:MAG: sugar kinase [SAR324 cluster bacterium]|nr:sugar kinase [SAR324 cluster bacterium]
MTIFAPDHFGPTINIGEILAEIMATEIGNGFEEPIRLMGPFPSGAPAIFIDQCAKISGSAAMIGAVGSDDFGRLNINRLREDGADVSGILINESFPTGTAFVRYRENGQRDFVFNIAKSAATQIDWCPAIESIVNKAGHLHVMGTALIDPGIGGVIQRAANIIKRRGGSISLDPNLRKELKIDESASLRFDEIIEICDLLMPSDDELILTARENDFDKALSSLFAKGIKEIVLKQGSLGASVYLPDGNCFHCPSLKVRQVDPTGAGDCFGGTYVSCRRLGMSMEQSLNYANASGARNVSVLGPMEGTSTLEELENFIDAQS